MSKPLSLEKYTDTKTFYLGRRLKTDFTGAYGILPSGGADAATAGWKGNAAAVVPYSAAHDTPIPSGAWGIVTAMIDDYYVDALFLWKSRGTIVSAIFTGLHCSNFVTSRGGPPLVGESESLAGVHAAPKVAAPAPVAAPAVATDADAALDAIRKLIGGGAAPMDEEALKRAVKEQLDPFREAMQPVMDILARMKSDPIVRGKVMVAAAASKNSIVDFLANYYQAGLPTPSLICLAAPPSIGKTFAFRQLGASYDSYLEHGCTDDIDEISTLLGSAAPDGKGGFVVFDGVLTQAVRAASEGKAVLLLLDEVFRLGKRPMDWLLTFLTGVKTPSGKVYRLRTRRVMADGSLEVIECLAANLHLAAATNLGAKSPDQAFWDRWEHHRLPFDADSVKATTLSFAAHYAVTDPDVLATRFTAAVVTSRAAVADGSLKYPLSFRALENAAEFVSRRGAVTADAVCQHIAATVADRCAAWGVDSGETDPASTTAVSLVRLSLGVK